MERPLEEYGFFRALTALPFVESVWLFGSRARGYAAPRSDVDLAVVAPRASAADWDRALELVEEADTLLRVDLVRFDALAPDDRCGRPSCGIGACCMSVGRCDAARPGLDQASRGFGAGIKDAARRLRRSPSAILDTGPEAARERGLAGTEERPLPAEPRNRVRGTRDRGLMNAALDQAYAERRALLERALARFAEVLERDPAQDDVVVDAGIQRFEFSIELFWRVVQAALQRLPPVTAP